MPDTITSTVNAGIGKRVRPRKEVDKQVVIEDDAFYDSREAMDVEVRSVLKKTIGAEAEGKHLCTFPEGHKVSTLRRRGYEPVIDPDTNEQMDYKGDLYWMIDKELSDRRRRARAMMAANAARDLIHEGTDPGISDVFKAPTD